MKDILVGTRSPYHVYVGSGLLNDIGELLSGLTPVPKSVMVVTDAHVAPLYLEQALASLAKFRTCKCIVPPGEEHKTPETLIRIVRALAQAELTRSDMVLTLGGGVVGDMAGFASAIYQRGVRFAQAPTTLLSAVDASVGGKTAVDLPEGKNMIGEFHQPSLVVCDTDTFRTLPGARFADGTAEMIKHGMIADAVLFEQMRSLAWRDDVPAAIARNIEIKRSFVIGDERDTGKRQLLNFGHTIGHAVEAWSGFTLSHGQSVAIGMVMETRAARLLGLSSFHEALLVEALEANELPTSVDAPAEELLHFALHDKKRQIDQVNVAMAADVGEARLIGLDLEAFRRYIEAGGVR